MIDARASRAVIEQLIDTWRLQALDNRTQAEDEPNPAPGRIAAGVLDACVDDLRALLANVLGSPRLQKEEEEDLSRMGTTGQSIDSRTASSVTPTATDGKKEPKNFPFGIERTDAADTCGGCGGPYAFDTTVPSAVWNRVVRPLGISEYLCLGCVVRIFAERGESFTAELSGKQDAFNGLPIRVRVGPVKQSTRNFNESEIVKGASAEVVSPHEKAKRWTEVLCTKCGGNGTVKIPGGVSTCEHCDGRCYEPVAAEVVSPLQTFIDEQRDLPPDAAKVLYDNLRELYGAEVVSQPPQEGG